MITPENMQAVLALASALDPRIPQASEATVAAWTEAFSDYNFELEDLLRATHLHYQETSDRVMPSHVIKHAKREAAMRRRRKWAEGIAGCTLCDDEGWVHDEDDRYGWAVRCRHNIHQEIPVKPGHGPSTGRPQTQEQIQASLDAYWLSVRAYSDQKKARYASQPQSKGDRRSPSSSGPVPYDPDAWT